MHDTLVGCSPHERDKRACWSAGTRGRRKSGRRGTGRGKGGPGHSGRRGFVSQREQSMGRGACLGWLFPLYIDPGTHLPFPVARRYHWRDRRENESYVEDSAARKDHGKQHEVSR